MNGFTRWMGFPRLFLSGVCVLIALVSGGCGSSKSKPRLDDILRKPGGIDKINQETIDIFAYFTTNRGDHFSYHVVCPEAWKFPIIPSLSSGSGYFFVERNALGLPECIKVPFGTHRNPKFHYIYHPAKTNWADVPSSRVQITSNIFTSKR